MRGLMDFNIKDIEVEKLGSKFKNLYILKDYVKVPYAICLSSDLLNNVLLEYLMNFSKLESFFIELQTTAGCYILETYPKIRNQIENFKIVDNNKKLLINILQKYIINGTKYAVRSSSIHEDSKTYSFAGIYNTTLGVVGINAIIEAIEIAVKNYYSYAAIIARIRSNNYNHMLELNLIVQEMVYGDISGVAFSNIKFKDKVYVEYVNGLGENLVSGEAEAKSYYEGMYNDSNSSMLEKVIEQVKVIRNKIGCDVDVEWTCKNSEIFILQARPITTLKSINEELFEYDRLYIDTNIEKEGNLNNCKKVYENYTDKRSMYYLLAQKNNICRGKGYVFRFNSSGLQKNLDLLMRLLESDYSHKVVIDIDDFIRQNIVLKCELYDYLNNMFAKSSDQNEETIIIREFVSGDCGCISRYVNDGILIEYSKDGLLSINRGLADCYSIFIKKDYDFKDEQSLLLNEKCISDICKFTKDLAINGFNSMIEWSVFDNNAFFIDYSNELSDKMCMNFENKNKVIVNGNVEGQILHLEMNKTMERLSISPGVSVNEISEKLLNNEDLIGIIKEIKQLPKKPIIFVDKPYAILTLLFEYAEGFVFKQGSLLCHLSIMLREYNLPSIICPEMNVIVDEYKNAIILGGNLIGVES